MCKLSLKSCLSYYYLIIFLTSPCEGRTGQDEIKAKLDSFIEEFMACREIPGLTLSIVHMDEVFYSRGYGKADVENDVDVTANGTLFCVASLTKAFTATLVEKLYPGSTGKNSPPIMEILKDNAEDDDCCKFADEYISDHVTMVDLLSHRTGIGRYDFLWIRGDMTRKEIIRRIRFMESVYGFRDRPLYSNIMFSLAGHVLEITKGESWETLLTRHLLEPLGMNSTTFIGRTPKKGTTFAKQYENAGGTITKVPMALHNGSVEIGPAISLCTTADDMTRWMTFNLRGGKVRGSGERILPESSILDIHTPVVIGLEMYEFQLKKPTFPVRLIYDRYAKGWFVGYYRDKPVLMHYGSYPGLYSMITLLKGLNLGIFTSMHGAKNTIPFEYLNLLHLYIMDLFMGKTPWLNGTSVCSFPRWGQFTRTQSTSGAPKRKPLQRPSYEYIGTYMHPVFGDLIVRRSGKGLQMKFGRIVSNMFPVNSTHFNIYEIVHEWLIGGARVEFVFDSDNSSVVSIKIPSLERRIPTIFIRHNQALSIQMTYVIWLCLLITFYI